MRAEMFVTFKNVVEADNIGLMLKHQEYWRYKFALEAIDGDPQAVLSDLCARLSHYKRMLVECVPEQSEHEWIDILIAALSATKRAISAIERVSAEKHAVADSDLGD